MDFPLKGSCDMDAQTELLFSFRRRVIKVAAGAVLVVCGSCVFMGYWGVALGFGLGAVASIAGFWFAVKKSLRLLVIADSNRAAAYSFAWLVPRFLLFGLALAIGAKYSSVSFAAVAAGIFLCHVILVLYEPVISRFGAGPGEAPGVSRGA